MVLRERQLVSVHSPTLKDVTDSCHGGQGEIKAVMAAVVESSTLRSAQAQSISSALTKTVNGSSIQGNAGDQANLTAGMFKAPMVDSLVVRTEVREWPWAGHHQVVHRVAPQETREEGDSSKEVVMGDPRGGWVTRIHFFRY